MKKNIHKMKAIENHNFAEYFNNYINLVEEEDLQKALKKSFKEVKYFVKNLTEEQGNFAYAKKKWTVKELLVHVMDTERIFCERALRFARNDDKELPGFDHDIFVKNSAANQRTLKDILKEYKVIRKSTLALFKSFTPEMLEKGGIANGNKMTVLSIGFIISGHELHHLNILRKNYFID
ncbi:MAG TPA: DinB family protein [Vicingus sp.]|nr:DinB family protein [Vicingus sp.]